MERISGPHFGFYIASYAGESGEAGDQFLGYAKICRRRPGSYWDADCLVKVCGLQLHPSAQAALVEAERQARQHVLGFAGPGVPAAA